MKRLLFLWIIVVGGSVALYAGDVLIGSSKATSLSQTIAQMRPHDTLVFAEGEYALDGEITIDKPLTLLARGEVILQAAESSGIFHVKADSVTIKGFTLRNVDRSYTEDLAAIWLDGVYDFKIIDNRIENCFFAIFCTKAKFGIIRGNVIRGNAVDEHSSANAIHLWYCGKVEIIDNLVENHRDGIYLEFTDRSCIAGNRSRNNLRYGLHFMFSNHDEYVHNVFENNGAGVAVMFSDYIVMKYNEFRKNWGGSSYGLLLKEIYDGEIAHNRFYKNTMAILAEGSTRMLYQRNDFVENGWAIKMRGSSMDNELTRNNFRGNSFSIATDKTTSTNNYHHNYWEDYEGYDLDRDGVGDVPHRPVSLFSYMTTKIDASILLLRSSFVEVLNFTEKIAPAVTPEKLVDEQPLMRPVDDTF